MSPMALVTAFSAAVKEMRAWEVAPLTDDATLDSSFFRSSDDVLLR